MNDATLLKRVHRRLMELRRQRAVAKKRDRFDRQQKQTAWELFADTAVAEGYSLNDPVVLYAWLLKQGEQVDLDDDDMEQDHKDLTF
jgi:hypothetical protein